MVKLRTILALTTKELVSLGRDRFLLGFVLYAFTFSIYLQATSESQDLRNAAVAISDQDHSEISRRFASTFQAPHFKPPRLVESKEIESLMASADVTFAIDIPPRFEADLLSKKSPTIGLLVDATAMSQAGLGASHIQASLNQEVAEFLRGRTRASPSPPPLELRAAFNQSLKGTWYTGVVKLVDMTTMLAILLAGAAIVREREHGTLEHLLVMPVRPVEIMLAKILANGAVILALAALSLRFVLEGLLGFESAGSVWLFLLGVACYLFFAGSFGIFLGTVSRSMQQMALLFILVVTPMNLLSGGRTPLESMPIWLQSIMQLSPSTHYVSLAQAILFRGADFSIVWPHFVGTLAIGSGFFAYSLFRFRRFLAAQN